MERNRDILQLGVATALTKGPGGPIVDARLGQMLPGLAQD